MTYHPAKPRRQELRKAPDFVPEKIFQGDVPNPEQAFDLFARLFEKLHFGDFHGQLAGRPLLLELLIHLLDDRVRTACLERRPPTSPAWCEGN
ncbi:MAG: hypothetical protein BGO12_23000 [Verrucomicrobia bacterium 61-8]|nr:hypothetical protein [Verrucomicrobiota bacterium]OJU98568.1 MAG: hypothetical protein BGO12_23000 [Verrucomicrobia bacterium 61-8]